MPLSLISSGFVMGDKLQPIRAHTNTFWRWAAIGQAKVRANLSITGGRRFSRVSGRINVARIKFFGSPANFAKSWFLFSGSVPAPNSSEVICDSVLLNRRVGESVG